MRTFVLGIALALANGLSASAATLDFTTLGSGYLDLTSASLPEASITTDFQNLEVGAGGIENSICAIYVIGIEGRCDGDLKIDFVNDVKNLTFDVGGWDDGDSVILSVLDASLNVLITLSIVADGAIDLSAFSGISQLFFEDHSFDEDPHGGGLAYGNFEFDVVPLPAALPLFGTGLAAMGFIAWRRKRKAAA